MPSASSKEMRRAATALGWVFDRQKGSHISMVKEGAPRPLVFPADVKDLSKLVIGNCFSQLGINSWDEFRKLI